MPEVTATGVQADRERATAVDGGRGDNRTSPGRAVLPGLSAGPEDGFVEVPCRDVEPVTPRHFEQLRDEYLRISGAEQASADFPVVQDELFQMVDCRATHRNAKLTDYARPNHERPNHERSNHER